MVRKLLSTMELLFGEGTDPRFRSSFTSRNAGNTAPGENNIVDKCSNMLCLSPEFHRFWEKGLFALEPVGHCRRLKASEDSWGVLDMELSELNLDGTSREDEETDEKLSSMFTSASDTEPVITHNVPSKRSSQVDMDLDHDVKNRRTDEKGKTPDTFGKGQPLLKQDMDDRYEYGIVLRFHWLPATTLTKLDAKTPLSTPIHATYKHPTITLRRTTMHFQDVQLLMDVSSGSGQRTRMSFLTGTRCNFNGLLSGFCAWVELLTRAFTTRTGPTTTRISAFELRTIVSYSSKSLSTRWPHPRGIPRTPTNNPMRADNDGGNDDDRNGPLIHET
ncbi:hypothetical protein CGCSCA4_v013748 [Colletotrichum siamense]|uniref:HNH nuclease domain-containing protein n=1 Tax=Colletotrichum siamense TaxID=690259 RepID=A0A9P5BMI5_COLSI|nr:hypothetical protein CGCSCA4_v013748 [Colletotrichum siamense]KAF4845075.1 hypothetical protein CGCSCA2_v013715 [Colletotrichum siamense]